MYFNFFQYTYVNKLYSFYSNFNHIITLFYILQVSCDLYSIDISWIRRVHTYDYIELCYFFKLLSVSSCQCRIRCPCQYLCFIGCDSIDRSDIPIMSISPSQSLWPFKLKRTQFPYYSVICND